MGLSKFSRDVIRALVALKNRQDSVQVPRRGGGGGVATGPFCKVFPDDTEWKLLGGTITGGDLTETIADILIGTVGSEPVDGTFYWLKCSYTGEVEDLVLLPGGDLTAVAAVGNGLVVPNNQIPTAATPAGFVYLVLGQWNGSVFTPSGCGDVTLTHCPGSLSYSRL